MSDKVREEFEAKHPLPSGVAWKGSIGMYEVVDIWKLDQAITISRYNWLWEGWQASREALVIALPALKVGDRYSSVSKSWNDAVVICQAQIEESGLKVKP